MNATERPLAEMLDSATSTSINGDGITVTVSIKSSVDTAKVTVTATNADGSVTAECTVKTQWHNVEDEDMCGSVAVATRQATTRAIDQVSAAIQGVGVVGDRLAAPCALEG